MRSLFRTLTLRYWGRRWGRLLLLLLSISLGVTTWVATTALNRTIQKASRAAATPLDGDADFYISNGDAGVERPLVDALHITGVRAVRPLVLQRILVPDLASRSALLLGVDLAEAEGADPAWTISARSLTPQMYMKAMILRQQPAFVGKELDAALGPQGEQFNILAAGQVYRVRRAGRIEGHGPAATFSGNVVVMDCDTAAGLLGRPDLVSRIDLMLEPGADRDDVRQRVEIALAGKAHISAPEGQDARVQDMLQAPAIGFALCGAAVLVLGVFLVYNALAISGMERRHDVGVLRCLGATRAQVCGLFLGESAVIGIVAGLLGTPAGIGLGWLCLGPVQQVVGDIFLPVEMTHLEIAPGIVAGALVVGLVTALLGGLVPALQAGWLEPIEAVQRTPGQRAPQRRLQAAGSLVLLAMGIFCQLACPWLPMRLVTYGSLVFVVVAALVALPMLAKVLARLWQPLARRFLGISAQLAAHHLWRTPARTAVPIIVLASGMALLLQTGGLIRSNETAIRDWVDQSIAGDLFITSGGPLSASGRTLPMADRVADRLCAAFPEIEVVPMRFRYLDWSQDNHAARILVLALDAGRYVAANDKRQPPLPDLDRYRQLQKPGTALVSENFAQLYGLRAGDPITLPGAEGPISLHIIGTVADYSCNGGTVLVDRAQYRHALDADLVDVLDAYLPAGADSDSVRQRLQQSPLAAAEALCVLTRHDVRGHILGMVGRLYGLAYTQEIVVGIVALVAVLTAMMIAVVQRRRELGLLRALGATRGQVLRSVLAEALLMAAISILLGIALGLPLEWYTVRVVLAQESGFRCPVRIAWAAAAAGALLALTAAVVAGLAPALHAVHADIGDMIAYE